SPDSTVFHLTYGTVRYVAAKPGEITVRTDPVDIRIGIHCTDTSSTASTYPKVLRDGVVFISKKGADSILNCRCCSIRTDKGTVDRPADSHDVPIIVRASGEPILQKAVQPT